MRVYYCCGNEGREAQEDRDASGDMHDLDGRVMRMARAVVCARKWNLVSDIASQGSLQHNIREETPSVLQHSAFYRRR